MISTLVPLSPHRLFGIPQGRRWAVVRDDRRLGEITEVAEGDSTRYEWRTNATVGFSPICGNGTYWEAQAAVERRADLPGRMRPGVPAELKIARVEDGAEIKPADGVSDD
jgi:hypothetical protein